MNWLKTYGPRLVAPFVGLLLLSTVWTDQHKDHFAPSSYGAAAEAMRTLPGISCPPSVPPTKYPCVWDDWTLTLSPTGTRPGLCGAPEVHVIFGGDAWTIRLTPTEPGTDPSPPTGSSPRYAELLHAFNFGNGANWMAC